MPDVQAVIVGAGFGGIGAAIELQKHGFTELAILDAADGIGGTWLHNTYPGCACDVPSQLYSFSFAQRRDWTRLCSPQPEILAYLRDVAHEFGVDRYVVPNTRVADCSFDDTTKRWTVTSAGGETWNAGAVILATGQLHQPSWPKLPGRENFQGHVFHSAEWDHDYDLTGKRVAVIGTGASAVQFVPEIVNQVKQLVVYQRTGNWFLGRPNRAYPGALRWAIKTLPGVQAYRRGFKYHHGEFLTLMIRHPNTFGRLGAFSSAAEMRKQIKDPALRAKLMPDYTFGCKRVLFSSTFLPALQEPNAELVTDAITGLTEDGVSSADGQTRPVDCIIYGTGFKTQDFMFPMDIAGTGGRSLRDAWAGGPHAHLGITVPGFPSLFVMYGPNTNTSGGSIIVYLEAQARYIRQAMQTVRDRGAAAIDVRADVEAAYDENTQARFRNTAWQRCDSWYRDESGRIVTNWPGYMREYEAAVASFDPSEYQLVS